MKHLLVLLFFSSSIFAAEPVFRLNKVTSVQQKSTQKAGGKSKSSKATKAAQKPTVTKKEEKAGSDKSVRSFKVMLPGTDNFVGRFTGLTPYQAANKALSKYYRETKN